MDIQTSTLANGLQVVSAHLPHVSSAAVGVWVGLGGRHEPAPITGMSHFIEHMLFKGTPTRSPAQISFEIEGRGGYFNAFTQEENTCYYGKILAEYQADLLDVLLDMYKSATLPADELEKERGVIIEEIMMYLDQPSQLVQDLLQQGLWDRHPLGRPLIGTPQIIQSITRKQMVDFKKANYHPANTVVTFSGNVEHQQCVEQTRSRVGKMRARPRPRMQPVTRNTKQAFIKEFHKSYEQTHLAVGYRLFGNRDPERFTAKLMSVILGENMSSRLFQIIREKYALAYSIHSSAQFFKDSGCLTIQAGIDKHQTRKTLRLIFKEISKLRKKRIAETELMRARDYAIGQLMMGLETSTSVMMWCGESMMSYGKIHQPEWVRKQLEAVTTTDLQNFAQKHLCEEHLTLSLVGEKDPTIKEEDLKQWARSP